MARPKNTYIVVEFNRPERAWSVRWTEYVHGTRHWRVRTFTTQEEALACRADALQPRNPVRTFRELWDAYAGRHPMAVVVQRGTIADYTYVARDSLLPLFGDQSLDSIATEVVDQLRADLLAGRGIDSAPRKKKRSRATAREVLVILRAVMRFGRDKLQRVSRNPLDGANVPNVQPRQGYVPTTEEVTALRGAFTEPEHRLMIDTMLLAGMHSGELRGLTWSSVDLKLARLRRRPWGSGYRGHRG